MATPPTQTRSWIFVNYPKGMPSYEGENPTFKLVPTVLPELQKDQVLVRALYLSNEPAQRGWIEQTLPADRSFMPPISINSPMLVRGLGEVIASTSDKFTVGSIVQAMIGWTEHAVLNASQCAAQPPLPNGLSLTHYLGAFGLNGMTAYYGLAFVGEVQPGMRVVVSGAAGATGSLVVQIAKKVLQCAQVIGIAGSEQKCRWVEHLGADKCLNYRSPTFEQELVEATDGYVDRFFDNVGGPTLDLMLSRLKKGGVVMACGAISMYNTNQPLTLKNYFQIISMRLSIRGFITGDYFHKAPEMVQLLIQATVDGKLDISEENEDVVPCKFEDVPKTWLRLFDGLNTGKLIAKLV